MLRFLIVVAVFALVTYLMVRMLQERDGATRGGTPQQRKPRRRPSAPPKMVAPDDDEDFLRDLDRRRLNPEDPESRDG